MEKFNAAYYTEQAVNWIKEFTDQNSVKGYVVGISGGKDSAAVAGLLTKAVGKDRVFGVLMPNGAQPDIQDSILVCNHLGINYKTVNIQNAFEGIVSQFETLSAETKTNIQPRLRMTVLYAVASELGFLVCGTGNASEKYIGYCTKWGDAACDLNPIADFTTDEVVAVGEYLGLPEQVVRKTPSDGLCGKTDEDNIGFSYEVLNRYLKTGECECPKTREKIERLHSQNCHKFNPIPVFVKKNKGQE